MQNGWRNKRMDGENTGIDGVLATFNSSELANSISTDDMLYTLSYRSLTPRQRQELKDILYGYNDNYLDDEFWKDLLDFFRESGYDYPTSPLRRMINKIEDVVYDR